MKRVTAPVSRLGEGRPRHPNTFNATPAYAIRKRRQQQRRGERNQVTLSLLGFTGFSVEELNGEPRRKA